MKAGAHLQEARDPTAQRHATLGRLGDAAQDFEQRALAGAVATDDADDFALLHLEAYILERPELLDLVALHDLPPADQVGGLARKASRLAYDGVAQRRMAIELCGLVADQVALGEVFNCDDGV